MHIFNIDPSKGDDQAGGMYHPNLRLVLECSSLVWRTAGGSGYCGAVPRVGTLRQGAECARTCMGFGWASAPRLLLLMILLVLPVLLLLLLLLSLLLLMTLCVLLLLLRLVAMSLVATHEGTAVVDAG